MTQRITRLLSSGNIVISIIIAVFIHTSVLAVTDSYVLIITVCNSVFSNSLSLSLSLSLSPPLPPPSSISLLYFFYVHQLASYADNNGVIAKGRFFYDNN